MKILTISDLNWNREAIKISEKDSREVFKKLNTSKFSRVNFYYKLIRNHSPNLVLFAGDVTGDGTCGNGFSWAFISLLELLNKDKIRTCFIQGDHDKDLYYNLCIESSHKMEYVDFADNKILNYDGIKILGLPYNTCHYKSQLLKCTTEGVDIILAHCEQSKRLLLFNFDTKFIITGHWDNKVLFVDNKIFISLNNHLNSPNYAIIDYMTNDSRINYYYEHYFDFKIKPFSYSYLFKNFKFSFRKSESNIFVKDNLSKFDLYNYNFIPLKYLMCKSYKNVLESVIKNKKNKLSISEEILESYKNVVYYEDRKIGRKMLDEYLK